MSSYFQPEPLRLGCRGFAEDEIAALRRLLALLQSHLPRRWALARADEAPALTIVNLDAEPATCADGASVVGCALRPKLHAHGTLYRPIRAYQLLSLLGGFQARGEDPALDDAPGRFDAWRYRLRSWPAQAMGWPRDWWTVMAAIRGVHRSPAEIAAQTGLAHDVVAACLTELGRLSAVDAEAAPAAAPALPARARATHWRELSRRVGQILGFAR